MSVYREKLQVEKTIIVLDYYDGAYGPTIRIDVQTRDSLAVVKDIFLRLADSKELTVDFTKVESVLTIGLKRFWLKSLTNNNDKHKKHLIREKNVQDNGAFSWAMSSTNWRRCAALIDELFVSDCGHQYLTREGVDDALVEVAFME